MTVRNLEYAVHPRSVVVVGASVRKGSVGRVVVSNIVNGGFEGEVWPVNPKYKDVAGGAASRALKTFRQFPILPSSSHPRPRCRV